MCGLTFQPIVDRSSFWSAEQGKYNSPYPRTCLWWIWSREKGSTVYPASACSFSTPRLHPVLTHGFMVYLSVAFLRHLNIGHGSLPRLSTFPAPNIQTTFNSCAPLKFFHVLHETRFHAISPCVSVHYVRLFYASHPLLRSVWSSSNAFSFFRGSFAILCVFLLYRWFFCVIQHLGSLIMMLFGFAVLLIIIFFSRD